MIPFDAIDNLMMPLEERLEAFYMRTLTDSSRSLSSLLRAKNALNPASFYANKYLAADKLYDNIVARIAKLSGYTEKELRLIFKRAGFESIRDDAAMIGKLGLEVPELATSDVLTGAVNAVFARTNVVLQNLTRSIAYQSEMAFIGAVDDAFLAVSTGTMGIDQAVKQGVLNLAEQGVRVLNSQTGRVEQADVAIKRNVWTGVNQATGDMTLAMAAEVGTDYVEVSAHPGARNKGAGPMNHASWQGKVYSISGKDAKYEALIPTTGYGTGPGLLGWNCRHSLFLHFPGFEQPNYTQSELDRMNNTQVTYNGKQMDLYEATQQQRYLERGVRDWKRKQAMFESAGLGEDHQMAGVKIQDWQARLRDFTNKTGLERRMEWEQVAGVKAQRPSWGKSTMPEVKAPVMPKTETYNDVINRLQNKVQFGNGAPDLSRLELATVKDIESQFSKLIDQYPQMIGKFSSLEVTDMKPSVLANYQHSGRRMTLNGLRWTDRNSLSSSYERSVLQGYSPKGTTYKSIISHEFGHAVDALMTDAGHSLVEKARNLAGGRKVSASELIQRKFFTKRSDYANQLVKSNLSDYATENAAEMFAEGFAEFTDSQNPRKFSLNIKKFMDEWMKDIK